MAAILTQMIRWAQRKGKRVEFGNILGGFCGLTYVYEFKTEKKAIEFEAFVKQKDAKGSPVAVPKSWHKYQVKQERTARP